MEQHFILCGLGRVGWRVLKHLCAAGEPIVVIDNHCQPDDPRLGGCRLVQGDCRLTEVLREAGVTTARGVLILTSDDLANLSAALAVHQLNAEARLVVRMFNQGLLRRLGKSWNLAVLSTSALAAPVMALIGRSGAALGAFSLEEGKQQEVAELEVHAGSSLSGLSVAEASARGPCAPVAHVPQGQPARFFQALDLDARLSAGDRLVVCGCPDSLDVLRAASTGMTVPELRWAGKLRRFSRVAVRTLADVDLPVKICAAVLLSVIVVSTLLFHLSMHYDTIPDALYRTISLMATAADMAGRELEPGGWQKVFVSALRITGAALTAAFTAILTNYLVRAQLSGALEVRRIPESGHIVVCGLSNLGFRIVEELRRDNEQVVVLEGARDNPFIAAARRLGAAVIVGDAAVADVLRQARADTARAVMTVTRNELANLEIALLTRELNPAKRVIVRLTDPDLASTLRESADIRLALSVPDLAAPAFVAALFGNRVRGVFLIAGRLLAAVEMTIPSQGDPWEGHSLETLANDYGFRPVCTSAGEVLRPGSRLTAIVELTDLHRLLRRERPPRPPLAD
jgi:Trk K+ transport system NAD-binding subunit